MAICYYRHEIGREGCILLKIINIRKGTSHLQQANAALSLPSISSNVLRNKTWYGLNMPIKNTVRRHLPTHICSE